MVVPGIGLGSWLDFNIQARMGVTKFECFLSCDEVLRFRVRAPGVIKPMSFRCCALTNRKDSARSESFDTITAQS